MNMSSSACHDPVYVPMDAIQNQYVYIQPAQTSPVSILSIQNPTPSYPDNYLAADEIAISGVKKRKSRTVVHEKWSKEEDKRLTDAVKKYGAKNWKKIASEVGGSRNDVQCLHRWRKVISPELVKGPWTHDEDMVIVKAVRDAGDVNNIKWCEVAAKLKGRIGKQCRERYLNYLDQNIKKTEWTEEEDKILFELQRVIGNRWCEIAKVLPGRSENNIKNRFNSKAKATYLLHHRTPMIPIQNLCTASPEDDPRQPRKKRKLMCPPLQQLLRYLNLSSQMLESIIPPLPPCQSSNSNSSNSTNSSSSSNSCCSSSSSSVINGNVSNNEMIITDSMSIDDNVINGEIISSSVPALLPLSSSSSHQLNDNIFGNMNNEEDELNLLTKPTLTIVDQPFSTNINNINDNIIINNNNHLNNNNNNNGYNMRSNRYNNNNNTTYGVSTRSRSRNNNNGYYTGKYSVGTTRRTTRNSAAAAAAAAAAEKQRKQKEMKQQQLQLQQQQQQQLQLQQLQQQQLQQQQQEYLEQQQYPQFLYYFQPFIPSFTLNTYENGIYNEYDITEQNPALQPPTLQTIAAPPPSAPSAPSALLQPTPQSASSTSSLLQQQQQQLQQLISGSNQDQQSQSQQQQQQQQQPSSLDEYDSENPSSIMFQNNLYNNFSTSISNNANNSNLNNNIFIQSMDDSNNSLSNSALNNLMMLSDTSCNGNSNIIEEDEEVRMYLNENGRYNDTIVPIPPFIDETSSNSPNSANNNNTSTNTTATETSSSTTTTLTSDDLDDVSLSNSSPSLVINNNNTD